MPEKKQRLFPQSLHAEAALAARNPHFGRPESIGKLCSQNCHRNCHRTTDHRPVGVCPCPCVRRDLGDLMARERDFDRAGRNSHGCRGGFSIRD